MNCQQGGPQTCSTAEYISYEDFEHGMRIMNTTDFTLNESMYFLIFSIKSTKLIVYNLGKVK